MYYEILETKNRI